MAIDKNIPELIQMLKLNKDCLFKLDSEKLTVIRNLEIMNLLSDINN